MHSPKVAPNKNNLLEDNVNVNVSKGISACDSFVAVREMSSYGKNELYFATLIVLADLQYTMSLYKQVKLTKQIVWVIIRLQSQRGKNSVPVHQYIIVLRRDVLVEYHRAVVPCC